MTFYSARLALAQGEAAIGLGETVFDLAGVKSADSSGVALLLAWQRRARDAGQKLTFINVPGNIDALTQLARLGAVQNPLPSTRDPRTNP